MLDRNLEEAKLKTAEKAVAALSAGGQRGLAGDWLRVAAFPMTLPTGAELRAGGVHLLSFVPSDLPRATQVTIRLAWSSTRTRRPWSTWRSSARACTWTRAPPSRRVTCGTTSRRYAVYSVPSAVQLSVCQLQDDDHHVVVIGMYSSLPKTALNRKKEFRSAADFDHDQVVAVEVIHFTGHTAGIRTGHINSVLLEVKDGFPSFITIEPKEITKVRFISIGTPFMSIRTVRTRSGHAMSVPNPGLAQLCHRLCSLRCVSCVFVCV